MMSSQKRKSDVLTDHDEKSDGDSSPIKSLGSDDSCESTKRRKIDLDGSLLDLGYTGTKEDLDKMSKKQKKKLIRKLNWEKNKRSRRYASVLHVFMLFKLFDL